ncbi:MAG: response regulator [Lentisphaeria bacterium]|nr:response regulator [Lentisphaeria bacterium]
MAKILVIDDDANTLISTRRILESDRHECVKAGNGQEVLEYVKQNRFALLIPGMRLPDMNGLSLVRELKKVEPSMPVILITAYASCENAVEAVKRGVYEYLVKPFQADGLLATVKRALGANMDSTGDS